jgi:glycosyltransferase involved in cell wall biosynthesis
VRGVSRRVVILTEIIAPYRIPVFNALAEREGVDLQVIFLAETDPTQRQWRIYKEDIRFSYEVLSSLRKKIRGHNVLLNWGTEKALRRAAPDVILCGGYNYVASWSALRWAERTQVPFFLWVESTKNDFRSGDRWTESLKVRFLRRCRGFVVPGQASCNYLDGYGVPRSRMFIAPNAVDNQFFEQQSSRVRQQADFHRRSLGLPSRFFLFVGRLVKEKGIFDLLDAYRALPAGLRREIGLVFVGDGPAYAELVRRAGDDGLILVVGFAQREGLASYYALADALVFPTHTDPWGLVVNEAMACGLPVICSDAAGCAEDLVQGCRNGRIVPAGDVAQLSGAMTEIATSGESLVGMGERSRERIQSYSPEFCAAGIAQAVLAREVRAA